MKTGWCISKSMAYNPLYMYDSGVSDTDYTCLVNSLQGNCDFVTLYICIDKRSNTV